MDTLQPRHGPEETQLLGTLKDVQRILGNSLDSLCEKTPPTAEANYLGWAAVSLNQASGGYLRLRESVMTHASKLLVRPALEATFSGIAAIKNREFLFRKAYSEWDEDKKLLARDAAGKKAASEALKELKRSFKQHCPNHPVACKGISVRETAEMAGLSAVYERTYRMYCQFTHCALRAATGQLNEATDPADTGTVIWCVLMMLDHLQRHTPAQIPDLANFKKALADAERRRGGIQK